MRMKNGLVAAMMIGALVSQVRLPALTAQGGTNGAAPAVGQSAPDFSLDRLDGETIRLSALREEGPVVVLVLRGWVGYQCPICNRQVGQYLGAARDLRAEDASVVMVYPGSADIVRDRAEDFITGKTLPEGFHFVIDPDLSLVNRYGVRWEAPDQNAYPATFVVDAAGTVRFAHVGKDQADRPPVADVLAVLDGLD